MSRFSRDIAHQRATDTTRDLTAVGVVLPEDVTAALARLEAHLERGRPTAPDAAALAEAYAEGATDKALDVLLAQHVAATAKAAAYAEACKRLGSHVMSALTANGDAITRQLADLAQPIIDKLEATAALTTLDVAVLVRHGDNAGADLAARAEVTAGDLSNLYRLRAAVTHGAEYGVGGWNASMWRNPAAIRQAEATNTLRPSMTGAERYLVGIRAGGELWFPTPAEAVAVAQQYATQEQRERLAAEAAEFGRGIRWAS